MEAEEKDEPTLSTGGNNEHGNGDLNSTPPKPAGNSVPKGTGTVSANIRGLTQAESNDPEQISVYITDKKAPLVILFGPPACGKTMTLVRMTRFLRSEGYTVQPDRNFRPTADTYYKDICEHFDETMDSVYAASSTNLISFMLAQVLKDGRRLCQILEAPGEHYFNPQEPRTIFPNYVNTIINSEIRKIWIIMLEPDWKDLEDRRHYVAQIRRLKLNIRPRDSVIFLYNKIDLTSLVIHIGKVHEHQAIKDVQDLFPGVFVPFENDHPITKFFKPYNFDFVPFSTGTYGKDMDGKSTYQEGPSVYCAKLWKVITHKIRG